MVKRIKKLERSQKHFTKCFERKIRHNCLSCNRSHKIDKSCSGYRYPTITKRIQRTIYRATTPAERKRLERARKDLDTYPFSHPKYKEAWATLESFTKKD